MRSGLVLIFAAKEIESPQSQSTALRCSIATASSMDPICACKSVVSLAMVFCCGCDSLSCFTQLSMSAGFVLFGAQVLSILSLSPLCISTSSGAV